jgi:hypothetical protein
MGLAANMSMRERFAHFQESDFCDWLSRGLKAFYARKQVQNSADGARSGLLSDSLTSEAVATVPFDFAYPLIGRRESLLDDIQYIYNQHIPDEKKIVFRLSIGRLFRQCVGDDRFPEPAVSDLIYLMAKVKAHESLECLAPVIGRGKYGQQKKWLQYEAIAIFKALLPAKEAVEGLRNLVTLPNFCAGYSFDVLTALCRADPARWFSAFELMGGHIATLWEQAQRIGDDAIREVEGAARNFAKAFSGFMPTSAIAEQVPRINLTTLSSELYVSGTWLVKELFTGDSPPIVMPEKNGTFTDDLAFIKIPMRVANQPSRRTTIAWEPERYKTFRSLQLEHYMANFLHLLGRRQSPGPTAAVSERILRKLPHITRKQSVAYVSLDMR